MAALGGGLGLVAVVAAISAWHFGGNSLGGLDAPCADRLGRPLKAEDVVDAFAAEGFTMRSLPESFYCNTGNFGPGLRSATLVAEVSNRRSVTQDEEVVAREGWATCHISRGSSSWSSKLTAELNRGPDSPIFSGSKAVFDLANVACSLYPRGDDGDVQIARAHAAMRRLERQLSG
jgi:hypothetical protein